MAHYQSQYALLVHSFFQYLIKEALMAYIFILLIYSRTCSNFAVLSNITFFLITLLNISSSLGLDHMLKSFLMFAKLCVRD